LRPRPGDISTDQRRLTPPLNLHQCFADAGATSGSLGNENLGAVDCLDFMVIGPAVNKGARTLRYGGSHIALANGEGAKDECALLGVKRA
jgi:hypothetical protein